MKKLTIAIPTYNRKDTLKSVIKILLEQITEECKILILDNNSDYDINDELYSLINNNSNIEIKKNEINIGFGGNICRCFLETKTEWMWLLGDDDFPQKDALKTILKNLNKYNDVLAFKYSYSYLDQKVEYKNIIINSVGELLEKFEEKKEIVNFSNFLYMSTFIFKTSLIKKELKIGYETAGTYANHISMLFAANIKSKKSIMLSSDIIVKNRIVSYEDKWSRLKVGMGIIGLLNVRNNLSPIQKKLFINSLAKFINIKELFIETINELIYEKNTIVLEEYIQIYNFLLSRSDNILIKLYYKLTRIFLLNYKLSYRILNHFFDINRGKKIEERM